jgi:hypothetical protein
MITEIIPFFFVIDRKFVRIFTLKHLEVSESNSTRGTDLLLAESPANDEEIKEGSSDEEAPSPKILDVDEKRSGSINTAENGAVSHTNSIKGPESPRENSLVQSKVKTKVNTVKMSLDNISEAMLTQERQNLEESLMIKDSNLLVKGQALQKEWYRSGEKKFMKTKLGGIFECTYEGRSDLMVRVMDYDRISTYQIESYFKELTKMKLFKLNPFLVSPLAVYISS